MKNKLFLFVIGLMLFLPLFFVQAKITPDCGQVVNGVIEKPCDFNYLMQLVNNVIKFMLFTIATPLVALITVYAGFNMIANSTNTEKALKAKKIMINVVVGYVIALASWLIINTILTRLGYNGPTLLK